MELSNNFAFNCNNLIVEPMQLQLKDLYQEFQNQIGQLNPVYVKLKSLVIGILDDLDTVPTVEQVDVLNADLAQLLITLQDGGINFDSLGSAAFGMMQSGFEFDDLTGEISSLPFETVQQLIKWVQNSIRQGTNDRYCDSVLALSKLMNTINKESLEKMILMIDSIIAANAKPIVTIEKITEDLNKLGLSFDADPNISLIDIHISELFVQKHLVTTKLYTAIEKQLYFLGGYDPDLTKTIAESLNTPYSFNHV